MVLTRRKMENIWSRMMGGMPMKSSFAIVLLLVIFAMTSTRLSLVMIKSIPPCDNRLEFATQAPSLADTVPPLVQVFVVMTPAHGVNWERFYQNSIGWHTHFPNLKAFTFDQVPPNSQLTRLVESMETFDFEQSQKHSNLLLAALKRVYEVNPHSDWYLLTEDDTIVVKENLDRLVSELNKRGEAQKEVYYGKCAQSKDTNFGTINFVVGGAGILMSGQLLKKLVPQIDPCRQKYNNMFYGDARVGACIQHELKMDFLFKNCAPAGYSFENGAPINVMNTAERVTDNLIVTLHEKDPQNIRLLNEAVSRITEDKDTSALRWRTLRDYWEKNVTMS